VRLSLVVSRFACGRLEAGVPRWVGNKKDAVFRPRLALSGLVAFASQPKQPSSAHTALVVFIKLKKKLKAKRF
jgi:hypothetical protein